MDVKYFGWIFLICVLCITTFGLFWCVTVILGLVTFLLGLLTVLYLQHGDLENVLDCGLLEDPLEEHKSTPGLEKVLSHMDIAKTPTKSDERLTGSDVIDRAIREILGYILRDHVHSWFHIISKDPGFDKQIKASVQHAVIGIAERMKQVDWLKFLTTRLVDDAATHIKLYRQAKESLNNSSTPIGKRSPRNSPKKFLGDKSSNFKLHRRNKSEPDLTWHLGNKESQKPGGSSKLHSSDQSNDNDEPSKIVGAMLALDKRCQALTSEEKLEEYLIRIIDLLLFFILPPRDFNCPTLRAVLGPIIACGVLKPLLNILSDPDTVNMMIIKLCCRDSLPSGEYLLTAIRVCKDPQELGAMRELVVNEIKQLRSNSNSDGSSKQQLGSLQYVQKLIESRIRNLHGHMVPQGVHLPEAVLPRLPLEELLQNGVPLYYYLEYLTIVGYQSYLCFFLNVQGWKVSCEQQISDAQVNMMRGTKSSNVEHGYDTMRDAALTIYREYLSSTGASHLDVPPILVQYLMDRIQDRSVVPNERWFDALQEYVYEKFKTEDVFLIDFWHSSTYLKLMAELDLLAQPHTEDDNSSLDNISVSSLEIAMDQSSNDSGSVHTYNGTDIPIIPTIKAETVCNDSDSIIAKGYDLSVLPIVAATSSLSHPLDLLKKKNNSLPRDISSQVLSNCNMEHLLPMIRNENINRLKYMKHTRSHSDSSTSVQTEDKVQNYNRQISEALHGYTANPGSSIVQSHLSRSTKKSPNQGELPIRINLHEESVLTSNGRSNSEGHYENKMSGSPGEQLTVLGDYKLLIEIIETGVVCESGKSWGVYALRVIRQRSSLEDTDPVMRECWHVYRRYSHFLDLQKAVKKKFSDLAKLQFPKKKAFHNMERATLEHRMSVLNSYMNNLCLSCRGHPGLVNVLAEFCEPQAYDKKVAGGAVIRTIDTIVNPLRSGMRSIKNMPDTLLNGMDELVGGLSRVLLGKEPFLSSADDIEDRPGKACIEMDPDFAHVWTKIVSFLTRLKSLLTMCKSPLKRSAQKTFKRDLHPVSNDFNLVSKDAVFVQTCAKSGSILIHALRGLSHVKSMPDNPALQSALMLLDEAFDLKGRSQWLRRGVLGRILQGTFLGGMANKKLLHLASSLAGHNMVLKAFNFIQQSVWPGGERLTKGPQRDQDTMYRTKMFAKTALLSTLSDELKHMLGSETTRSGLLNVFSLLQQKELNLRLLLVVLESILMTLYPNIEKALTDTMDKS